MSSLPARFSFGAQSATSVRDAIASYRRAQLYLSDTVFTSTDDGESDDDDFAFDEENEIEGPIAEAAEPSYDTVVGDLEWDEEELSPSPSSATTTTGPVREFLIAPPTLTATRTNSGTKTVVPKASASHERTPLLRKTTSLSFLERPTPRRVPVTRAAFPADDTLHIPAITSGRRASQLSAISRTSTRRVSTGRAAKYLPSGQSTFGQTLFNAIAILLGIGMLSEPLAFAYAGWIGGSFLIISYGLITCYTAKILGHIILADPRLRSYSDIGRKAFGPRSGPLISTLFCLELFTVSVALITLFADSLHAVEPNYSVTFYKLMGLLIIVPTMFMPLSWLSYASIIGILSTLLIVAVIFIDGFSTFESPGSLWRPADTSFSYRNLGELGVSFGLFMAGYSGHAVIPSLVRDMADPSQFDVMIDYAFLVATTIYATIGIAGYLMFGDSVSDEFSKDLMKVPSYNHFINQVALWGLVLSPLSKYTLATRPMNLTIEMVLGIDTSSHIVDDHGVDLKPDSDNIPNGHSIRQHVAVLKRIFTAFERVALALLSVAVSVMVPEFSSMMAFLGAFSSFLLCVIGPLSAKMALGGRASLFDVGVLFVATVMATWGTISAFWSAT